jgi:hypothetical protein
MQHHVFLSYSHENIDIMQRVCESLRAVGLLVWTDEGIKPGTPLWKDSIEEAIEKTGCLVVILSPEAKKSLWVKRELEYAEIQEKSIIPLLGKGIIKDAVPFGIIGMQLIDITTEFGFGISKLASHVRDLLDLGEIVQITSYTREIYADKVESVIKQLSDKAQTQNDSITYDDLLDLLPEVERDIPLLDEIMDRLVALEINVVPAQDMEPGFLDFGLDGDLAIQNLNVYLANLTTLTLELGANMTMRTKELGSVSNNITGQAHIVRNASLDMTKYAKEVDRILPGFHGSWETFGENVTQLLTFANKDNFEERDAARTFRLQLQELQDSLRNAQSGIGSLLTSILGLPEISKDIKRGKRQSSNAISKLIEELNIGDSILTNILSALDDLLGL